MIDLHELRKSLERYRDWCQDHGDPEEAGLNTAIELAEQAVLANAVRNMLAELRPSVYERAQVSLAAKKE